MPDEDQLQIRIHGDDSKPTLIYLPGVHGDWTLVSSFRERMKSHVRFVEFIYPRTLNWSLQDYADAVLAKLAENGIHEGVLLGESYGSQVAWPMLKRCMECGHPARGESGRTGRSARASSVESGNSVAPEHAEPLRAGSPRSESTAPEIFDHLGSMEGRHSCRPETERADRNVAFPFTPHALILSGGFVSFPFVALVDLTRFIWAIMPNWLIRFNFWIYATFARWRHRNAPETAAAIKKFIERRTPEDLRAIDHRFKLIRESHPEEIASRVDIPVYQLTGFWDPVVHFPASRRWLRKNCPGYRETHVIGSGDHNILGTVPDKAAEVMRKWIARSPDRVNDNECTQHHPLEQQGSNRESPRPCRVGEAATPPAQD